jgi:hypothetical protein
MVFVQHTGYIADFDSLSWRPLSFRTGSFTSETRLSKNLWTGCASRVFPNDQPPLRYNSCRYFRCWHLADMAKKHRDVRSWPPTNIAQMCPKACGFRTELLLQQLQFLDVIRTCNQAVTVLMVVGSSQSGQYKSLILLWWACLDSNQEPDRYERWKLATGCLKTPVFIEF